MPVEKRLRGLVLSDQTESDSLDEFPHINEQDKKRMHRKQLRAKKSRDAAQKRRDLESVEMKHIIDALPYSEEYLTKLDKNSVIKLTIAYIRMKHYLQKDMAKASIEKPQIRCQSNGHFTKELHKNSSAICKSTDIVEDEVMLNEGELMLEAFNGFVIFVSKRSKKILYVSESIEQHLGLQQVSLLGTSVFDCIHPLDHKEFQKQMLLNIPEEATQALILPSQSNFNAKWQEEDLQRTFYIRMKYNLPKPGAKVRSSGYTLVQWIGKLKVHPSVGKPGGVSMDGLLCICHPLQSTSILEIRMDGNMFMSRHEMDMRFTFCDHRIATLIGYDPSEVIGKSAYQFHNPLDAPKVSNCHSNLIIKGTSVSTYYRFLGKNKDWVWLQTRATIIYNTNNKPQYVVCMNYVISEEEGDRHLQMEQQRKMAELTEIETTESTDMCEVVCAPHQSTFGPSQSLPPNVCSENIGGSLSEDGGYESNSSPSSSNSPLSYSKHSFESPPGSSSVTLTVDQGIDHGSMDSFDMPDSTSFSCAADSLEYIAPTAENLTLNLDPPDVSTASAVDFLDIFGTIEEDIEMMDSNNSAPVQVPTFHALKSDELKETSNIMVTEENTSVSCEMTPGIFSQETTQRSLLRNLLSCEKETGFRPFLSSNCQDDGSYTSSEKISQNHILDSTPESYSNCLQSHNSEMRSFDSQTGVQGCSLDEVLISDTETFSSVNSQMPRMRTTKGLASVHVSMLNPTDIPLIQDTSGLGPTDEFSEFAIQYLESLTETEAQAMIAELGQAPDLMDIGDDYFSSLQCDGPQMVPSPGVANSPCLASKLSRPMVISNDGTNSRNSGSADVQSPVIDSSNIHLTAKNVAQQHCLCSVDNFRHSRNGSNTLQLSITELSSDAISHVSSNNNCSVSLNSNFSAKSGNSCVSQNCTGSLNSTPNKNLILDSTVFKKPEQSPQAVVLPIKQHVANLDHRYHQNTCQPDRFSSSVPRRTQSSEELLDDQHSIHGLKPQQQLSQSMTELEKILRGYVSDVPPIFSLSNRREPRPLLELFLTNQMSKEMYQRMERDRQVTGEFSRSCQQSGQTVANG
ncbi:hypothetical protein ACJMK2_038188 [Sinanodonta woodiana]|uniref:Uncharacterized protein n=1 Tax=Sinanodonta woodiana TaxID=1069815 RepID=A0ABD3WP79_SINWO